MEYFDELNEVLRAAIEGLQVKPERISDQEIPVGISNRHIHLAKAELEKLFGAGYALTKMKDLSQKGQYAAKETITICGPKGVIEGIRILGPCRSKTQVELFRSDDYKLGIRSPLRMSGDVSQSAGLTLVGPKGSVQIGEGAIVAKRHIHMSPMDAKNFQVNDGDVVSIEISGERGGVLHQVAIRVTDTSTLECHLDMEEANALGVTATTKVKIIR